MAPISFQRACKVISSSVAFFHSSLFINDSAASHNSLLSWKLWSISVLSPAKKRRLAS